MSPRMRLMMIHDPRCLVFSHIFFIFVFNIDIFTVSDRNNKTLYKLYLRRHWYLAWNTTCVLTYKRRLFHSSRIFCISPNPNIIFPGPWDPIQHASSQSRKSLCGTQINLSWPFPNEFILIRSYFQRKYLVSHLNFLHLAWQLSPSILGCFSRFR